MPNSAEGRLLEVLCEAVSWGRDTFPQETVQSLANHIAKEAVELANAPTDPDEMADVLMLLAGLIDKVGVDVAAACRRKLAENQTREWGTPGPDGVTHHVAPPPGRHCPDCGALLLVPTSPPLAVAVVVYCLACHWYVVVRGPRCGPCQGTGVLLTHRLNGGAGSAPCTGCRGTGKRS